MKGIGIGICVLLAFAVAAFGGVEPWGAGILEIGAAGLFLWWGILGARRSEMEIQWNWLYVPMIGLLAIALGQEVFRISAYPYATKIEVFKWIAYLLLCFLAAEAFRTTEKRNWLAWFLARNWRLSLGTRADFAISICSLWQTKVICPPLADLLTTSSGNRAETETLNSVVQSFLRR
jgi:hypothetical protein